MIDDQSKKTRKAFKMHAHTNTYIHMTTVNNITVEYLI